MTRLPQVIFSLSVLCASWLGMMAVHEFGHVLGAWGTGGQVERVVLHPLTISRTDVAPNPRPGVVVWMGPLLGVSLPLGLLAWTRAVAPLVRNVLQFFAGFCLVANGAYIAFGAIDMVGDCRVMFETGTPVWMMGAFGAVAVPAGLLTWHHLGSPMDFWRSPAAISAKAAVLMSLVCISVVATACLLR